MGAARGVRGLLRHGGSLGPKMGSLKNARKEANEHLFANNLFAFFKLPILGLPQPVLGYLEAVLAYLGLSWGCLGAILGYVGSILEQKNSLKGLIGL